MVKFCPVCNRSYADDVEFCTTDRTPLVFARDETPGGVGGGWGDRGDGPQRGRTGGLNGYAAAHPRPEP